jgi:hypothetical protein
MEVSLLSNPLR